MGKEEPDEADNHYAAAVNGFKRTRQETEIPGALFHRGQLWEKFSQWDRAATFLEAALQEALDCKAAGLTPKMEVGHIYYESCIIAQQRGRWDEALDFGNKAVCDLRLRPHDAHSLAMALTEHGCTHSAVGLFKQADRLISEAIAIFERSPESADGCTAHYYLGCCRMGEENWTGATECFQECLALDIKSRVGNSAQRPLVQPLRRLGECMLELGKIPEARDLFAQANRSELKPSLRNRIDSLVMEGWLSAKEGNLGSAIATLQEALELDQGHEQRHLRHDTVLRLGRLLIQAGAPEHARSLLLEALSEPEIGTPSHDISMIKALLLTLG